MEAMKAKAAAKAKELAAAGAAKAEELAAAGSAKALEAAKAYTGKDDYQFGDITKASASKAQEMGQRAAEAIDTAFTEIYEDLPDECLGPKLLATDVFKGSELMRMHDMCDATLAPALALSLTQMGRGTRPLTCRLCTTCATLRPPSQPHPPTNPDPHTLLTPHQVRRGVRKPVGGRDGD